jgi:hypothetical protein
MWASAASSSRLHAGLKGQQPLLDRELWGLVRPDESSWSVVDGAALEVSLQKADGQWWQSLMKELAEAAMHQP